MVIRDEEFQEVLIVTSGTLFEDDSEFNIFMLKSGRISMAGVSSNTVDYLAESIAKVL